MKAKELMDKEFIYVSKDDSVVEVSKTMEKIRRFTCPVVDDNKRLIGWVTSFDITRGLREGNEKIHEIMSSYEEITTINENESARLAVIETADNKFVTLPVLNDDNQVIGMIRACDIVKLLSALYDIKVVKLYEAMNEQLKGITWDELMEASAVVSRRATGKKITPEQYEDNIRKSTFGSAIWATGGLEKFFTGLIAVGELVIARKVGRARKK
ncbi:MAG: CBS domain-containing protein [Methanobrevibacter woesei]|jgi:CBS domain-containing protein|uniref:CBS domain-containing protein n=1 Tax=Methanobrevibacter woesei TaxID=190976 RepID=UPI001FA26AC3|nr:CBS domain-containing protein [Methanobrevibacter woesei]MCC9261504.1 CBS domain-containing protein [Methanobrevibacter woesei]MCI7290612.1 CBS domain-containing protein [Methanobrevibacter woesei]